MSACSQGDEPDVAGGEKSGQYIRLTLSIPAGQTRAEDSHSEKENAFSYECKIKNISLFVYNSPNGLNSSPDTPIQDKYYLDNDSTEFNQEGSKVIINFQTNNYSITEGDRLCALVNMGDLTRFTTLGDIQNHIPASTWTSGSSLSEYSDFTMANANSLDGEITIGNGQGENGSKENPFIANFEIERTAARIDLDCSGGKETENFLVYDALLQNGNKVATIYVSHVLPINAMQEASYALKHISGDTTDNFNCFSSVFYADFLPKDGVGHPSAYVVEPHTTQKRLPIINAEDWYGNSTASIIKKLGHDYFNEGNSLWNASINHPVLNNVRVIGYANENTQHINNHYAECLTGLIIRAQYVPVKIYSSADLKNTVPSVRDTDIWRYTPQNATTTEEDVLYFSDEETAIEYSHSHAADRAQIKSFPKGICYYNLWIRHTVTSEGNRPDGPVFPMEFGIVRNHIYRVAIGFRGIGREGVIIEDPWNIEPQIFVRPWNVFQHSTIIM